MKNVYFLFQNIIPVFAKNSIGLVEYPLLSEEKLTQMGVAPGVQAVINHEYVNRFCNEEPKRKSHLFSLTSSLGREGMVVNSQSVVFDSVNEMLKII